MGTRFLNKQIVILSENVKIRLKKDGGIYFVDENGDESKRYVLGRKTRQETDEVKRELSEKAVYKGFEINMIPQALPVTVNFVTPDNYGGAVQPDYILSNVPSEKMTMLERYLLKSLWATLRVNQFEVWRAIADTKADKLDMPAISTAKDELAVELVEERANSSFIYDQYFVESMFEGTIFNASSGMPWVPEVVLQNNEENELKELEVADLDLEFKIAFYGELDFQVLNT